MFTHIVKRDGRREFFDKHKLILGIERACQKRPVNAQDIAASIESELQNSIITEIAAKDIGEMVLARLKEQDMISYIRFASVYREFREIDSFMMKDDGSLPEIIPESIEAVANRILNR